MPDPELAARLAAVRSEISDAARAANRSADELTLIVVTKFHPARLVRDLVDLGVSDVGENRHQEAWEKARELTDCPVTWHFIGQLQSNKASAALEYADVIHSLDRMSLVTALDKAWQRRRETEDGLYSSAPIECFVQVNLTEDPHRGGVPEAQLEQFFTDLVGREAFSPLGIMAVAPLDEHPDDAFQRVAQMSSLVRGVLPEARFISAGMSHDFVSAIAHGATHLRIGTAITGNRPSTG